MEVLLVGVAAAFALGVQTAISPCPMATNIAAISFIGRQVSSSPSVLLAGLLYTLGRSLVYVGLAALLVGGFLADTAVSFWLQHYMHKLLGPVLIVVGMFMLELVQWNSSGGGLSERMQQRIEAGGIWSALPLGGLFAMSFCPGSAGVFFGFLIPLAVELNSRFVLPLVFGVATALPVIVFATAIAFSAQSVGRIYNLATQIDCWARRIAGGLFLVLGIFLSLLYCFEIRWLQPLDPARWW